MRDKPARESLDLRQRTGIDQSTMLAIHHSFIVMFIKPKIGIYPVDAIGSYHRTQFVDCIGLKVVHIRGDGDLSPFPFGEDLKLQTILAFNGDFCPE